MKCVPLKVVSASLFVRFRTVNLNVTFDRSVLKRLSVPAVKSTKCAARCEGDCDHRLPFRQQEYAPLTRRDCQLAFPPSIIPEHYQAVVTEPTRPRWTMPHEFHRSV